MKFSIITPTYNSELHLRETIESVLSQEGDFEIEYIIADGASSDETLRISQEYKNKIADGLFTHKCKGITFSYFSEKDKGMYDAINRGFARASGDIFAWINADDIYLPGAFQSIRKTFQKFPEIEWLKGITSFIKSDGKIYEHGRCFLYNRKWIQKGIYGRNAYFIHQDSVFWRKGLWEKSGGANSDLRLAGDYALWINFSKYAELWSLRYDVSCFRKRPGQLSSNMALYHEEQRMTCEEKGFLTLCVKTFFWLQAKRPQWMNGLFVALYRLAFRGKNQYFIDIDPNGEPIKKHTDLYALSK